MNQYIDNDDDMKIAPESMSKIQRSPDVGENIRRELTEQQHNGNMDLAKDAGEKLALFMISLVDEPEQWADLVKQKAVLFAFAVNMIVEESSVNSIVAQTVLTSFYQYLRTRSNLYETISDSAAFSLYISATKGLRAGGTIGSVFAKLLHKEEDVETVALGDELFAQYCRHCGDLFEQTPFKA